jgi:hypothetical protein
MNPNRNNGGYKVGTMSKPLERHLQQRKHQTVHHGQRRKTAHLQAMLDQHSRQRNRMVIKMESFSLNSAKSFIGKNVNLHLKDGAVIINVHLTSIRKGNFGKGNLIEYVPYGNRKSTRILLRNVAWAEMLNINLMHLAD